MGAGKRGTHTQVERGLNATSFKSEERFNIRGTIRKASQVRTSVRRKQKKEEPQACEENTPLCRFCQ